MFFWHPTGRLGWFRGDSCVPSGSEIYSSVPVRIRKGHTNGAHLPPPLNRAPGAPPPPPLSPSWNGVEGAELFGATRSIFEVEPVYLPIAVFSGSPTRFQGIS